MIRLIALISVLALTACGAWVGHRATQEAEMATDRWPPQGQILVIDGRRVHAFVAGSGPDLVLLHGAGGNLRDFTFDLVGRLQDRYRVIAFDRPGLGYTDRVSDAYAGAFNTQAESPAAQAALLSAAARQLGAENPIVLGHSYGGAVAMAWALNEPAAGVVSVAGAVMPWPGSLDPQYGILGSALGGAVLPPLLVTLASEDRIAQTVRGIFAPAPVPPGYIGHVGPGLTLRPEVLRANARQVNTLRPHLVTMAARYPDLRLPVAFVHGTADRTVGIDIHSRAALAVLPDATLTVLEGAGHMPQHSHPQAVTEAIDDIARRAGLR